MVLRAKHSYLIGFVRTRALRIGSIVLCIAGSSLGAEPTSKSASETAVPAWVAKAPAWPPILLTNRVVSNDKAVGYSGSAGLVRLPNDVVVLMTARHLLGEAKIADFAKAFKSWTAVATPTAVNGVQMTKVAMDVSEPDGFDALVLLPASQHMIWPSTVLPARQTPLEVGETVYLVAIPAEGKAGRQTVRKAVITKRESNNQLIYAVEGTFPTTGNSGAPVVDSQGRFCAVNTAHLNDQTEPGKMLLSGLDVTDVMRHIKLPPGMKPLVLSEPAAASESATGAVTSDDETKAEKLLAVADLAGTQGIPPEMAKVAYAEVVKKYPNTAAAKKAKAKLAGK